jgi:hypothetical protein
MTVKFWIMIGTSLLTIEIFIRSGVLSRCWAIVTVMRRAQRTLGRRVATEVRKEQLITALWLQTMKSTAVLALTIAAVFFPLALLYFADNLLNTRVFEWLDWGLGHWALIIVLVVYSFVRRRYGA